MSQLEPRNAQMSLQMTQMSINDFNRAKTSSSVSPNESKYVSKNSNKPNKT